MDLKQIGLVQVQPHDGVLSITRHILQGGVNLHFCGEKIDEIWIKFLPLMIPEDVPLVTSREAQY